MEGEVLRNPVPAPSASRGAPLATASTWRLIETPAQSGARNMAIDVALGESVRAGGLPVLRFYRWWPACISLGRNQTARGQYDLAEAERREIEFVRRPTGGRAVYHNREITYSVAIGERVLGGPRRTYRTIQRALLSGLRLLGARVDEAEHPSSAGRPGSTPCFAEIDGSALVARGRKLVGSAQLRERGVILQHGSILLTAEQSPATELLKVRRSGDAVEQAIGLDELLRFLPTWAELSDTLANGFERLLGIRMTRSMLEASEKRRVMEHVRRFDDPAWTWRL